LFWGGKIYRVKRCGKREKNKNMQQNNSFEEERKETRGR